MAGRVESVRIRRDGDRQPVELKEAEGLEGFGLRGDRHADPLSPRQVLLASSSVYARLGLPPGSLRENLTVSAEVRGWPSGTLLGVGSDLVLAVTFACEPCHRLNAHAPDLARRIGGDRGVLARVVRGGLVRPGAPLTTLPQALAPWSDRWQARLEAALAAVPEDQVVEYPHLARLIGVQTSYCRAFPRALASLPGELARKAVPAGGAAARSRWLGAELFAQWTGRPDAPRAEAGP